MALGLSGSGLITGFDPTASGFGKVLQVVRATDTTNRSTTSVASYVDASISVTITPQKSTSAILLIWTARIDPGNNNFARLRITDSANNAISGAEGAIFGGTTIGVSAGSLTVIGYATPATTLPITFKGRFYTESSGTAILQNSQNTGQLFAIEVAA